jgi:DNA-directed RNA polymerase specialized sigma24 family protein
MLSTRQHVVHGLESAGPVPRQLLVGKRGDLIALDDALATLAGVNPRHHRVVKLRISGGPSLKEIARALKVSAGTVRRDWRRAQPWLYREFSRSAL